MAIRGGSSSWGKKVILIFEKDKEEDPELQTVKAYFEARSKSSLKPFPDMKDRKMTGVASIPDTLLIFPFFKKESNHVYIFCRAVSGLNMKPNVGICILCTDIIF